MRTSAAQFNPSYILPNPQLAQRLVTEKDNGKTITVHSGNEVKLSLGSNPTTGYQWKVVQTDKTLGYPTENFVPSKPAAVGSGGTQEFVWETKNPVLNLVGKHTIKLAYMRPWDPTNPVKTFEITLNIKK